VESNGPARCPLPVPAPLPAVPPVPSSQPWVRRHCPRSATLRQVHRLRQQSRPRLHLPWCNWLISMRFCRCFYGQRCNPNRCSRSDRCVCCACVCACACACASVCSRRHFAEVCAYLGVGRTVRGPDFESGMRIYRCLMCMELQLQRPRFYCANSKLRTRTLARARTRVTNHDVYHTSAVASQRIKFEFIADSLFTLAARSIRPRSIHYSIPQHAHTLQFDLQLWDVWCESNTRETTRTIQPFATNACAGCYMDVLFPGKAAVVRASRPCSSSRTVSASVRAANACWRCATRSVSSRSLRASLTGSVATGLLV
jgi:hypothetical protein